MKGWWPSYTQSKKDQKVKVPTVDDTKLIYFYFWFTNFEVLLGVNRIPKLRKKKLIITWKIWV